MSGNRWLTMASVLLLIAVPALGQQETAEAAPTPAGPIVTRDLPDVMPEGTLLYIGWPGAEAFGTTAKDTALAKLLAEPEVVRFREAWNAKLMPAIERLILDEAGAESWAGMVGIAKRALGTLWEYPTAIGVVGFSGGEEGPQLDVAIVVHAGDAVNQVDANFAPLARMVPGEPEQVEIGQARLNQISMMGPAMPLRWGVMGEYFVLSLGTRVTDHLAGGEASKGLTTSERFRNAMEVTGGSAASPTLYLDLNGVVDTLGMLQPMLESFGVPVLGEEGGVQKLLDGWGWGTLESFSMAIVPEAGGFKTSIFIHAPALGSDMPSAEKPLTDADLALVPRDAAWASVANWDIAGFYRGVLNGINAVSPFFHDMIIAFIEEFEADLGLKIEEDILAAFGDTWAFYDAPSRGGLWFTGITIVVDVREGKSLDDAARRIVEYIVSKVGGDTDIPVGPEKYRRGGTGIAEETYREQTIHFVNVVGVPMPIAPAWAQCEGKYILGFYPQMVRLAIDQMMNQGESLLDNPDFQRIRKLTPEGAYLLKYVDTKAGVAQFYPILLPIGQMLMAMGQGEGIPADVTLLPSVGTVTKHLFGNVGVSVRTKDGMLSVMHGALPIPLPAIGQGGMALPLMASIALPSLARARELSKRTVSGANLKGLGMAMYTYANENEDKFPPDLQTLVGQGVITPHNLRSPLDESDDEVSYIYITGQTAGGHQEDALVYEKPENYEGEGTAVLFVDGHVEFLSMPDFERALRETGERLGRKLTIERPAPGIGEPVPVDPVAVEPDPAPDPRRDVAQMQVWMGGPLSTQLELYRLHTGGYPGELKLLATAPEGEAAAEKWRGPYIKDPDALKDPWGHELRYVAPGEHNPDGYDLWSVGPDGEDGTDDDVGNWN